MSSEQQNKAKKQNFGWLFALYTILFIGIQGMIASIVIGAIALISNGEKITVGSHDADIIFTSAAIGLLLEILVLMYFFILKVKDRREQELDQILSQAQTNPDGSTTINIITNNFQTKTNKMMTSPLCK